MYNFDQNTLATLSEFGWNGKGKHSFSYILAAIQACVDENEGELLDRMPKIPQAAKEFYTQLEGLTFPIVRPEEKAFVDTDGTRYRNFQVITFDMDSIRGKDTFSLSIPAEAVFFTKLLPIGARRYEHFPPKRPMEDYMTEIVSGSVGGIEYQWLYLSEEGEMYAGYSPFLMKVGNSVEDSIARLLNFEDLGWVEPELFRFKVR